MSQTGVDKAMKAYQAMKKASEELLTEFKDDQDMKLGKLLEIALECIQEAFLKATLGSGI